jgi:hypothetical protein
MGSSEKEPTSEEGLKAPQDFVKSLTVAVSISSIVHFVPIRNA